MALYASFAGLEVVEASIMIPYWGLWEADVLLAVPNNIPTQSTLTIGDLKMVGFAYRMFGFGGSRSVRLVGGFGGWQTQLIAKSYQSPSGIPLALVLGDAAKEAGEQINVPANLNPSIGQAYARAAGPASRVLRQLVSNLWYVDPATGIVQIAPRKTDRIASSFEVLHYSGGKGKFQITTETLSDWMPGRTFTNPTIVATNTVSLVRHQIDNKKGTLRTEILAA